MQPVNFGSPQQIPMYANCFDQLTTNGIVADDVMGYITGTPSPYLQNYVAQRGWNPSVPGQILPEPLPGMPPAQRLPNGDVYQKPVDNNFINPKKNDAWKKAALGLLLTGLAVFGLVKGKKLISKFKTKKVAAPTTPTTPAAPTTPVSNVKVGKMKKFLNWMNGVPNS